MQIQSPLFIFPLVYNNNFAMRSTLNERNTQYVTQNKIDYMLSMQWSYDKKIFFESVCKVGEEKAHKHIHNCPTQCFKVYLDRQSDTFLEPHQIFRYIYQRKIKSIYITMPNTHLQGQKFVFFKMYILQHKASDQSNKTKNKIHILSIAKSKHKMKCCKVFMKIKKTYIRIISVQ